MTIPLRLDATIPAGGHRYRIVDAGVLGVDMVWQCERCDQRTSPDSSFVDCTQPGPAR